MTISNNQMSENQKIFYKSFDKIFCGFDTDMCRLKKEFINTITGINKKAVINTLCKEFDGLGKSLYLYLKDYEPKLREIQEKSDPILYKQIKHINADAVITFNYTDTYVRYGINSNNVVHVHGSLKDKNIVLGFNDDNEAELDFVYLKKYMQCILKHTPVLKEIDFTVEIVDEMGNPTFERTAPKIHIFGHSLDETDRDKLLHIFKIADEVIIYFRDEDDYQEKIEKIIKLLGKTEALKRIYDKSIDFELIKNNPED